MTPRRPRFPGAPSLTEEIADSDERQEPPNDMLCDPGHPLSAMTEAVVAMDREGRRVDGQARALARARLERAIVAQVCHGHALDARAEVLARHGHAAPPAPRPRAARRWLPHSARAATG